MEGLIEAGAGVFLMELAKRLAVLLEASYRADVCPLSSKPNMDSPSKSLLAFMDDFWGHNRELQLMDRMTMENDPSHLVPFAKISELRRWATRERTWSWRGS